MAAAIRITVTAAGRAALRNLAGDGTNAVLVTAVGLTATAFASGSALPDEIKRVTTIKGGATAADTIHVTISDTGADVYSVRGFGLYLADGTLFASYGQPDVIVEKSAQAAMLISADVQFADIDATQITFGDTNFSNPGATTERMGIAELATDDETIAGTDTQRTVTPKGLLAAINARFGIGAPSDFVKTMLTKASVAAFVTALGIRSAAQYDTGAGNGLDADKLDGKDGSFYQAWANLTDVPTTFKPSPHTHNIANVDGLQDALNAKLALAGGAMLGAVTLFGGDAGVTPPQFDKDTSIATTEFVQRALGNFAGSPDFLAANAVLNASHAGKVIVLGTVTGGGTGTVWLPILSSLVKGTTITFTSGTVSPWIVVPSGPDIIGVNAASSANITVNSGDCVTFVYSGDNMWRVVGGSAQLKNASVFAASFGNGGYQKLPSGLILQWGINPSSNSADTYITFPIAFPNGPVACFITPSKVGAPSYANYWNLIKTGLVLNSWGPNGARDANQCCWIALGY
jgi:hypothetical protein